MKSRLLSAVAAVVVIAALLVLAWPSKMLGTDPRADAYTVNGAPIGSVLIAVPFTGDVSAGMRLQVAVDWNADGAVAGGEWVVRNVMPLARDGGVNRFAARIPEGRTVGDAIPVIIALTDASVNAWTEDARESVRAGAPVAKHDLLSVWDIATLGSSQELKRGLFAEVAHADDVDVQREGEVGDLSGGPMDCFPIAATNNIISLAEEHGQRNQLPANPQDMINELKRDMQFDNGVLTRNFVAGKQAFLARHGLSIVTEVIEKPTFQQIADALSEGGAVELSMANVRSASGHADTGHVVTVTGAASADGQMGVFAHDPATPEGADFLPVSAPPAGNTFWRLDYALWDGVTVIDFMYVQKWQTAATDTTSGVSMPEEKVSVATLIVGGKHYPFVQFHAANPDACGDMHYHSNAPFAIATDLSRMNDPGDCGFGTVSEVPKGTAEMTATERDALMLMIGPI